MTTIEKMMANPSLVNFIPASQERLDGIIAALKFIDSDEFDQFPFRNIEWEPLPWELWGDDEDEDF